MKRIILMLMTLLLIGCTSAELNKPQVAVSIVPQETFVKAITGDLMEVIVMIPPGNSPSNYEPSPKHMAEFEASSLYFTIDVAAEYNILQSVNKKIQVIDLADQVDEVYSARYFEEDNEEHDEADDQNDQDDDHDHEGRDPHIWLSPKRAILMIEIMLDELVKLDPNNQSVYRSNAESLIKEITELDKEIATILNKTKTKTFLIYHPSYGYFADDYNLDMIAIEKDGKEATIRGMESIILLAKEKDIRMVFYQEEFDGQQAEIIAKEIDGEAVKVSPLSSDYIGELQKIVNILKDTLN